MKEELEFWKMLYENNYLSDDGKDYYIEILLRR